MEGCSRRASLNLFGDHNTRGGTSAPPLLCLQVLGVWFLPGFRVSAGFFLKKTRTLSLCLTIGYVVLPGFRVFFLMHTREKKWVLCVCREGPKKTRETRKPATVVSKVKGVEW